MHNFLNYCNCRVFGRVCTWCVSVFPTIFRLFVTSISRLKRSYLWEVYKPASERPKHQIQSYIPFYLNSGGFLKWGFFKSPWVSIVKCTKMVESGWFGGTPILGQLLVTSISGMVNVKDNYPKTVLIRARRALAGLSWWIIIIIIVTRWCP